jgi:hypothetical protein
MLDRARVSGYDRPVPSIAMIRRPRFSRLSAWFALLALLCNLAQPFAASAARVSTHDFLEICTAQGLQRIAGDEPAPLPAKRHLHAEHCALCTQATAMYLLSPNRPGLHSTTATHVTHIGLPPVAAVSFSLLSAAPRGPPSLS